MTRCAWRSSWREVLIGTASGVSETSARVALCPRTALCRVLRGLGVTPVGASSMRRVLADRLYITRLVVGVGPRGALFQLRDFRLLSFSLWFAGTPFAARSTTSRLGQQSQSGEMDGAFGEGSNGGPSTSAGNTSRMLSSSRMRILHRCCIQIRTGRTPAHSTFRGY